MISGVQLFFVGCFAHMGHRKNSQIAGANCSIYGCGTSRKHFGVSIF